MAATNFTPISLYYSSTASNVPTAGNLVAGELAINTADGRLYYKDSAGVVQVIGTKGGVGSSTTTQVLYNSSGSLAGSANMTFNGTTLTLANDASISGLTVGKGGGAGSDNTAVGYNALTTNSTGIHNTAFGYNALTTNSTGQYNTAIGQAALQSATVGNNTAVGQASAYSTTTGTYITAIGTQAMLNNTTGSNSVAVGFQSLYSNTTASNNTAVGYQSLYSITTGGGVGNCTAVGYQAGYYNTNAGGVTAVGYKAAQSNTTGSVTAVGYEAGLANTTGGDNVFMGLRAGYSNTTGSSNVAMGRDSLYSNTIASYNTAVGYQAGYSNTVGINTVYIGYQAGYSQNVGAGAGYSTLIGSSAGYSLTTGTENTFIGSSHAGTGAGYYVTTGSKNTILGGYSGNQGGLDIRTSSNYIVLSDGDGNPRQIIDGSGNVLIGKTTGTNTAYGTYINQTGQLNLVVKTGNSQGIFLNRQDDTGNAITFRQANSDVGSISVTGTTTSYNITSDYRLKENVEPMVGALAKVSALKPVTYKWKVDGSASQGFIAHELQAVVPDAVTGEKDAVDEEGKPVYQGVDTSFLVATLTAAIQELKAEFDAYKATHP